MLAGIESIPLNYTENDSATAVSSTLTVTDLDQLDLQSATVQISNNFGADEDQLVFIDQNGISGSYDANTGILSLTGAASIADYEAALRSVAYENISENPVTNTRTVTYTVFDGTVSSNIEARPINIFALNDAPTLATIETAPAIYLENAAAVGITGNLSIGDVDDTLIESATVTIGTNYVAAEDTLTFTDQSGIVGSYLNGTLTLTGSATLAEYEAAIHSVGYVNSSADPTDLTRTIDIVVNDGDTYSNLLSRDIDVIPSNDPPVVSGIELTDLAYQENSGPDLSLIHI